MEEFPIGEILFANLYKIDTPGYGPANLPDNGGVP
jgi:hypothetical protein